MKKIIVALVFSSIVIACQRAAPAVSSDASTTQVLWDSIDPLPALDAEQLFVKDQWPGYFSFRERAAYLSATPSAEEFNLLIDELIEKQSSALAELPTWAQQPSIRARMKVVNTYLNQTKSLFGLKQSVHRELNAVFDGIKDLDRNLVLVHAQINDSVLFVQDTLPQTKY